jgi:DNA-binding beta-propeller fold protein YncE
VSCAEYAYVTSAADNTVSSYSVDATTGTLALVGTATVAGASPYAIAGTSNKRFLFVANESSNDVSVFNAGSTTTGAITEVPGSPYAAGTRPQAMLVLDAVNAPSSLIVLNAGSDNLSDYALDVNTGALQLPSTVATGKGPTSLVFDPVNGGIVFVANHGGSNDISGFYNFQWLSPVPIPGSPFPAGGNPLSLALGAGGEFLYSANPDASNPTISGFTVDRTTGVWSPISGSPFPLPVSHYIASDRTGAYLYVTTGANIVGYAIDATTGALTALPGFPVAVGVEAFSITIDPTNQFLYVADEGAAHVSGFTLHATTGALTPMAGSPFPAGNHPQTIATF